MSAAPSPAGPIKLKLSLSAKSANGPGPSTAPVPAASVGHVGSVASTSDGGVRQNAEAGPSKTPLAAQRPSPTKPKAKAKPKPKLKKPSLPATPSSSVSVPAIRPSAIPARLLSSTPSTPRNPVASLPDTPLDTPSSTGAYDTPVKLEPIDHDGISPERPSPDPLSLPMSPSAGEITPAPTPAEGSTNPPTPYSAPPTGKSVNKFARLKKPLKELLGKIIVELRKRDDYDLFSLPVNLEIYPDYLDIVGGEDKMMDLSTMQAKVDEGEYRSMDALEADLRMLVQAAQTYNPPGTIPHSSASKMLAHGLKQIDKLRPLVRTPSPSPERESSFAGTGREMTALTDDFGNPRQVELPPEHVIPTQMLDHPPNSAEALAVGWNLNGGKRVWAKRMIRSKEKFVGKWRHFDLDGTLELSEMDEIDSVFERFQAPGPGEIIDYPGMRRDGEWWDFEGYGGPEGKPPVAFAPFPRRERLRTRQLNRMEWGRDPEITEELGLLRRRAAAAASAAAPATPNAPRPPPPPIEDEETFLPEHLRPARGKAYRGMPANFVNIYEPRPAGDFVRDLCTGDTRGEAYLASIDRFVQGAITGRQPSNHLEDEEKNPNGSVQGDLDETADLDAFVMRTWHDGILQSSETGLVRKALDDLAALSSSLAGPTEFAFSSSFLDMPSRTGMEPLALVNSVEAAQRRLDMRDLLAAQGPLDIGAMLNDPQDFGYQGLGAKVGIAQGIKWVASELDKQIAIKFPPPPPEEELGRGKRKRGTGPSTSSGALSPSALKDAKKAKVESRGSSPLSDVPDEPSAEKSKPDVSAEQVNDGEAGLRQLRLELVALSKFYPLAALKKMDRKDAERLLPVNVRGLLAR